MSLRDEVWTVEDGDTASNGIVCGGDDVIGVLMPDDDSSGYTEVSFEVAFDDPAVADASATWYPILADGTAVTVAAVASASYITLPVEYLHGCSRIRAVLDAAADGADIIITPVGRRFF